ncbi:hypothetical protein H4R18_004768 [Coemansia javaensis]|uniref:Uncharacterized protein n=1 Tax=Coemansia javaensis TaxID=2761396 RepID=A0A9W8H8I2_9FUNG|nr:hypothetical protein H4R18_004768 [Coemansia javaensis]
MSQRTGGGGAAAQARQQPSTTYISLDGRVITEEADAAAAAAAAAASDDDDDDPTNTAMLLDENDERELAGVVPGTPMALKRLGQVTVKSITRQRVSQTPVRGQGTGLRRAQRGAGLGDAGYGGSESPSKKGGDGRQSAVLMGSRIPMMPAPAAARADAGQQLPEVPLSVRRLRSARRAGNILSRIKQMPPGARAPADSHPQEAGGPAPAFVLSRPADPAAEAAAVRAMRGDAAACATPVPKARRRRQDTPHSKSRAEPQQSEVEDDGSSLPRTPAKQPAGALDAATPAADCRERIESLRKFFCRADQDPAPGGSNNLLISFDGADRQACRGSPPLSPQLSQLSPIQGTGGADDLLQTPLLHCSARRPAAALGGLGRGAADESATSLLISFTSRLQDRDLDGPVPFALDGAGRQADDQSNLIDLSSRLHCSASALDQVFRKQAARNAAEGAAKEPAGSEIAKQLEALRKAMEETMAAVAAIQGELGQQRQGQAKEGARLDDIGRLLGALDMRLHMLEDRRRLDESAGLLADGLASPQRASAGSTKVRPGGAAAAAPRGVAGRAGQALAHCLARHPLLLIGALAVILVSELLVIGGAMPDMRALGTAALAAAERHAAAALGAAAATTTTQR